MVAMLGCARWRTFARAISAFSLGLALVACGGSSKSDDDDDGGSGGTTSGGGTGGAGKGGTGGGGSGKGGGAGDSSTGTGGVSGSGTGGGAATGGEGETTNVYLSQIRATGIDKLDLLFMIDNSLSMANKQQLFAEAVPVLVARLITPQCVDADRKPTGESADATGHCETGAPEFQPIRNVHLGIITSSLGDHGSGDVCSDQQNALNVMQGGTASSYNDLAQLVPSVRTTSNLVSWNNAGFLVWDPRDQDQVSDPHANLTANETEPKAFIEALQHQVTAAGESGCGYEASLESWYRFLVDPAPVTGLTNDSTTSVRGPVNTVVLKQREAFLRPDSALAILMLTDENDCSIIDEDTSQGWVVGYKGGVMSSTFWHMPRATSACAKNPNDKCCAPCILGDVAGCPAASTDSACSLGTALSTPEDSMNLRCFNQKARFGIDLLYPVQRYIDALTKRIVTPRFGGPEVPNPLFASDASGMPGREPGSVIVAGILGVPWQDVSTEASWEGRDLAYLDASGLAAEGRWDVMLGDPTMNVPPTDTLMVESIDPRTTGHPQTHPLVGAAIGAETATTLVNPINGHEHVARAVRDDLQYACIFELPTPIACDEKNYGSCDCHADEFDANSPLCEGTTSTVDGVQTHAKAYPGLRQLAVLKAVGENGVVASICAKNVEAEGTAATDSAYGYNPAVAAVVDKLSQQFSPKCLPRELALLPDEPGRVACQMLEATPSADGASPCACDAPGRSVASDEMRAAVVSGLRQSGSCDVTGQGACDDVCVCELAQFAGDELASCQAGDADTGQSYGFCYIDTAQGVGSDAAVATCPSNGKRLLRFMGEGVPDPGAYTFVACGPIAPD